MSDTETNRDVYAAGLCSLMEESPGRLDMRFTLVDTERKFRRACEQIVLLNSKLHALQDRYDLAKAANDRTFRYPLRLRLAVVEGMRNMYHDYAHWQAIQVSKLRTEIFGSDDDYQHSSSYGDDDVIDLV